MDSIKKLTELFSKFPTIGQRTASRFVTYLLKLPRERVNELIDAIKELKTNVKFCRFCFLPFEGGDNHCSICTSSARNHRLLCVVEKEADLLSIEHSKRFDGVYFVLGGSSSFRQQDVEQLRLRELVERVKNPAEFFTGNTRAESIDEVIIATNPTPEGKAIASLVERALKEISPLCKITRLARGLPMGGELEYADDETLEGAFAGRK